MNVVDFWQQQVTKWNDELKCGLCWEFGAPLTESAMNIQQPEDGKECCVKVMLVKLGFATNNTFDAVTGLTTQVLCNTNFQLIVMLPIGIGINNYNEIAGHPLSESKWETVLNKIHQCLACDAYLDFCEILGYAPRVTQWSGTMEINKTDNNYSGYRLSVNFQNVV